MNEHHLSALYAKKNELDYRRSLAREADAEGQSELLSVEQNPQSYDETQVGSYHNIGNILLRWIEPDLFEFLPNEVETFCFERQTGEVIAPTRMFTDGGSIPRVGWVLSDLSPWNYTPAFIVHDWEFDAHHCDLTEKTFDQVSATMMEGVKTLMETGICEKNVLAFNAIQAGIRSFIGVNAWEREVDPCPLP